MLAQRFESAMYEHADCSFLLAGDLGDLLIAEAVGPQVDRFSLAGRQCSDQLSQQRVQLSLFGRIRGIAFATVGWVELTPRAPTHRFTVGRRWVIGRGGLGRPYIASAGSKHVQRPVATDGVEP